MFDTVWPLSAASTCLVAKRRLIVFWSPNIFRRLGQGFTQRKDAQFILKCNDSCSWRNVNGPFWKDVVQDVHLPEEGKRFNLVEVTLVWCRVHSFRHVSAVVTDSLRFQNFYSSGIRRLHENSNLVDEFSFIYVAFSAIWPPFWILLFEIAIMGCTGKNT